MSYSRDKVISLRVNSKLLNEYQAIIDSQTKVYPTRGGRKFYHFEGAKKHSSDMYRKYSLADFLEDRLQEFIKLHKPQGAK